MQGRWVRGAAMGQKTILSCINAVERKHVGQRRLARMLLLITFCLGIIYLNLSPIKLRRQDLGSEGMSNSTPSLPAGKLTIQEKAIKVRRLPQALIIGARKSGTRALLRFLEVNPALKAAHKEVHFFDRMENYARGLTWYRNQMPETSLGELTIEKSPAYFVTREAPERVRAMNASVKLVLILRNPVTRLISDFSQTIANRLEGTSLSSLDDYYDHDETPKTAAGTRGIEMTNKDKNATLVWKEAEQEFERHILRADGGIEEQRRIVRIGMYSQHLERWLSVFQRDQFHFVDGERLIEQPHEELQKLEHFLGLVPSVIRQDSFVFSPDKGFYCLRRNSRSSLGEGKLSGKHDDTSEPVCLGKTKGRRHVVVKRDLREKLRNFYAPYNDYLFTMTGLNFNVRVHGPTRSLE